MHAHDIQKYCNLMEEVKSRFHVIDFIFDGKANIPCPNAEMESVGLQFRKVLELIAFGSLVANKASYMAAYDNFSKAWNADLLMKDLERVNPDFYPCPISEVPSGQAGVKAHIEPLKVGFLTKNEFVKVYKKCGALLHASNPNGSKLDYNYYKTNFPVWREQVFNLMRAHVIRLVGSQGFYLVHMEEAHDGKAHHYTFKPAP